MNSRQRDENSNLKTPAAQALELAYRSRDRQRCSKMDLATGFIAALKWLKQYEKYSLPSDSPNRDGQSP